MNETFAEDGTRIVMDLVTDALSTYVGELAEDIQASIATECPQYHEGHGGHSHPGSAPYSETGALHDSIESHIEREADGPDTVAGVVSTNVPYAPKLEYVMDRPFFAPAAKRAETELPDRLAQALS